MLRRSTWCSLIEDKHFEYLLMTRVGTYQVLHFFDDNIIFINELNDLFHYQSQLD